jgi:hypothetical protein
MKRALLALITFVGLATMLLVAANLYYRTQLLYIAQQAAEYGINQAYLFGLRRHPDLATVEAQTRAHIQPKLDALGLHAASVTFTTKVQSGYPYATVAISVPAINIVESATVIETDCVPPYISCFALSTGGPWRGGYLQVPTLAGGPFNGTSNGEFVGSVSPPPPGTTGPGAAYFDADISCTLIDAPHRYGLPTEGGWEY